MIKKFKTTLVAMNRTGWDENDIIKCIASGRPQLDNPCKEGDVVIAEFKYSGTSVFWQQQYLIVVGNERPQKGNWVYEYGVVSCIDILGGYSQDYEKYKPILFAYPPISKLPTIRVEDVREWINRGMPDLDVEMIRNEDLSLGPIVEYIIKVENNTVQIHWPETTPQTEADVLQVFYEMGNESKSVSNVDRAASDYARKTKLQVSNVDTWVLIDAFKAGHSLASKTDWDRIKINFAHFANQHGLSFDSIIDFFKTQLIK